MSSSLERLVATPPSGRKRPLLLDHYSYATAVMRQGTRPRWLDLASLTGPFGQVAALLDPDAVWLDVGALLDAHLAANPALVEAMGARSRTGYALRTLLADKAGIELVTRTAATLAGASRRPLVLSLPSPARWLGWAHTVAGTALESVDADRADTASMYLAEWLGRLGELPVAAVLLDARCADGDVAVEEAERLAACSAIGNVLAHFDWTVALRGSGRVETSDGIALAVVKQSYWFADEPAEVGVGDVLLATIPADAQPERVLDRLGRIS